jgi:hypothetical protein
LKNQEEKIKQLQQGLSEHDGELVIISQALYGPETNGLRSLRELVKEAEKRGWFK